MHPDCAVRSRPLEDPDNSAESASEKPVRQVLDLPVDRLKETCSDPYLRCLPIDRPTSYQTASIRQTAVFSVLWCWQFSNSLLSTDSSMYLASSCRIVSQPLLGHSPMVPHEIPQTSPRTWRACFADVSVTICR